MNNDEDEIKGRKEVVLVSTHCEGEILLEERKRVMKSYVYVYRVFMSRRGACVR
jgi:hypothetical protein